MAEGRIGERVAVLEERMERAEGDIRSLRTSRHEHSGMLQKLVDAPAELRELGRIVPRVESVEEEVDDMIKNVLPEINRTTRELAEEQRQIRESLIEHRTSSGWVRANLGYVLHLIEALTLIVLTARLAH